MLKTSERLIIAFPRAEAFLGVLNLLRCTRYHLTKTSNFSRMKRTPSFEEKCLNKFLFARGVEKTCQFSDWVKSAEKLSQRAKTLHSFHNLRDITGWRNPIHFNIYKKLPWSTIMIFLMHVSCNLTKTTALLSSFEERHTFSRFQCFVRSDHSRQSFDGIFGKQCNSLSIVYLARYVEIQRNLGFTNI